MAITDLHVAVLRAQLAGQGEEHQRLGSQLTSSEDQEGYAELLAAGFFTAVNDHFHRLEGAAATSAITDFVTHLRAKDPEIARHLDSRTGERMISHALGKGDVDDIDGDTMFTNQIIVLNGLIMDADPSDKELDDFMTRVRRLAES